MARVTADLPKFRQYRDHWRLLFGDRFKAGYGLADPAGIPLTPHEHAEYVYTAGQIMWDKHHSAADLEQYISGAPDWEELQLIPDKNGEHWYDNAARLAAKWILARVRAVPDELKLVVTFRSEMEAIMPRIADMHLSTAQWIWCEGAVRRICDAAEFDGRS